MNRMVQERERVGVAVGADNAGQSCNVRGAWVDATLGLSFLGLQLLGPLWMRALV